MQELGHLLRFPPQPEDREMAEEDEEADPLLEEEASDAEAEGAESIPLAESGEDDDDEDDEEEEPLARKGSRKHRATQLEEDASSAIPDASTGSSSGQPLAVLPLRDVPPPAKKKKYAPGWTLGPKMVATK